MKELSNINFALRERTTKLWENIRMTLLKVNVLNNLKGIRLINSLQDLIFPKSTYFPELFVLLVENFSTFID